MVTSPRVPPVFFIASPSGAHLRPIRAWMQCESAARSLFRGNVERHLFAEEVGLPGPVGHAKGQPDASGNFRSRTKVPPDGGTYHESEHRHYQIANLFFFGAEIV